MDRYTRILWLANALFETVAGLALLVAFPGLKDLPTLGWLTTDPNGQVLGQMYGWAALIIGLLSLYFSRQNTGSEDQLPMWIMFLFHTGMAFILAVLTPDMRPAVFHGLMGGLFLLSALRRRAVSLN